MAQKNPNTVIFSPVFCHSLPSTPASPQKNSGQFQPHLRKEEKSQTSFISSNCHENQWLGSREKACLFFQVTWPLLGKVSFASAWQRLGACKLSWPPSASSPRALGQLQAVISLAKRDYQVGCERWIGLIQQERAEDVRHKHMGAQALLTTHGTACFLNIPKGSYYVLSWTLVSCL